MLRIFSAWLNIVILVGITVMTATGAIGLVRPMNDGTNQVTRVVVDPAADQVVRVETAPAAFVPMGEVRVSSIRSRIEDMFAHYRQETDEGAATSQ